MESRHVVQALQDILADYPIEIEDREELIVLLTGRAEMLEAKEPREPDVPQNMEDVSEYSAGEDSDHQRDSHQKDDHQPNSHQKYGRQTIERTLDKRLWLIICAAIGLALIEFAIILVLLMSGGGKTNKPDEPVDPIISDDVTALPSSNDDAHDIEPTDNQESQPAPVASDEPVESNNETVQSNLNGDAADDNIINDQDLQPTDTTLVGLGESDDFVNATVQPDFGENSGGAESELPAIDGMNIQPEQS